MIKFPEKNNKQQIKRAFDAISSPGSERFRALSGSDSNLSKVLDHAAIELLESGALPRGIRRAIEKRLRKKRGKK